MDIALTWLKNKKQALSKKPESYFIFFSPVCSSVMNKTLKQMLQFGIKKKSFNLTIYWNRENTVSASDWRCIDAPTSDLV